MCHLLGTRGERRGMTLFSPYHLLNYIRIIAWKLNINKLNPENLEDTHLSILREILRKFEFITKI